MPAAEGPVVVDATPILAITSGRLELMAQNQQTERRPEGRPATMCTAFKIGDVFPADNPAKIAVVRFLLAGQSLLAIPKLHPFLPEEDPVLRDGTDLLMFLSIGLLRETAKAFHALEEEGLVKQLEQELISHDAATRSDFTERIDRLRTELAWGNPSSILRTFLKQARDAVAFHWESEAIKKELEKAAELEVPSVVVLSDALERGPQAAEVTIPLINGIRLGILESIAGSSEKLNDYVSLVASLQGDVFHVAHFLYRMVLNDAGVDIQPSGDA